MKKMDKNNYCIIMAGGVGSRFWPISRTSKPKQFIDFLGTGKSLLQATFDRFKKIIHLENIYIVTNKQYFNLVKEQIPEIDDKQIILEPIRRNTAPCIAYATNKIITHNTEAICVVAPSDHIIIDEINFLKTIEESMKAAATENILMTLGITPTRPDTGYGYIQYWTKNSHKEVFIDFKNPRIKKVKTFTEKPSYELAVSFINCGDFLWNSGVFIWSAKAILSALEEHLYEVYELFNGAKKYLNTEKESEYIEQVYMECPNISIDYGVMEKAQNAYVYISDFGWSDLGTWSSLYEHKEKDENDNVVFNKQSFLYNVRNSIIHLPKDKVAVIQGLDDYIVAESEGILLICKKSDEQNIRLYVNDVLIRKGEEFV